MWLVKGSSHGFCGWMSQCPGGGREIFGGVLSISTEIIDSSGSPLQWISTRENHIAVV